MPLILAEILARRKLSKRQFAKLLGVRYENVFVFFRPGWNPKLDTLEKIAKVLNLKVRSLFRG